MPHYYLAVVISIIFSLLLNWLLVRWATSRNIFIPKIRPRDSHQKPTPRVGGIAIVLTFLFVTLVWQFIRPEDLRFSNQNILGIDRNLFGVVLSVLILSCVNIIDDLRGLNWSTKLITQIIAALIIAFFGIKILWLTNPFGGHLSLGYLDITLVVVWLVALSNVVNWLDGINGLSAGVSAISLAIIFFLSISTIVAQKENALLAAIAFGAVIGFLPFNLAKASSFLGDTGSMFLGFIIGVLAIISGGKLATAFLVLAIPFLDAFIVVISRIFGHQSPFAADRRHLHHRFLALGFKPYQIVLLFYAVSLLFGLIALNTQTLGKFWALMSAFALMFLFILIYSIGGRIITYKNNLKR